MRCPKCGAEWTLAAGQAMSKFCPNCGTPLPQPKPKPTAAPDTLEGALQSIADTAGVSIFREGNRLLAYFADMAPRLQKERNLLSIFVQCQGNTLLLDAVGKSKSEQVRAWESVAQRIEKNFWLTGEPVRIVCTAFWQAVGGGALPPIPEISAASTTSVTQNTTTSETSTLNSSSVTIDGKTIRTDVTKLKCEIKSQEDMENLAKCTQLEQAELTVQTPEINFALLGKLPNLTYLYLNKCDSLTDIAPLSKLTNLTELYLDECHSIRDIVPLSRLSNLTCLGLYECHSIRDFAPLSHLSNLTNLNVTECHFTDIAPLSRLPNLTCLNLGCDDTMDIVPLSRLSNLTHLTSLSLTNYDLQDIASLNRLSNLTYLTLYECCNFTNIASLNRLPNLTSLTLHECYNLIDATPLRRLSKLTSLTLIHCYLLPDAQVDQLRTALPNCRIIAF